MAASSAVGLDRLGHALVDEIDEVADIDGHQHVGRRVGAFGGDPLRQAVLDEDGVDRDAGLLGEDVDQRLDQAGLAGGVEVDLAAAGAAAGKARAADRRRMAAPPPEIKSRIFSLSGDGLVRA